MLKASKAILFLVIYHHSCKQKVHQTTKAARFSLSGETPG
jgi:hypothetical protein